MRRRRARGAGLRQQHEPTAGEALMPRPPASRQLIQDLVAASRILAAHEVLDAYGHVSARSDRRPDRFFMSRSRAPALGTPVFEIREVRPENDLLIRDRPLGRALAGTLGECACVLMRGHGMTVVGDSVPEAVFRAIYTEMNARLQLQAGQLEGPVEFLSD